MQQYRPNLGPSGQHQQPQHPPQQPRRGMGPMPPGATQAQMTHQQQLQQAQQAQQAHLAHQEQLRKREDAQKRSQKPVDRSLPDGIEDLALGDTAEQYNRMRDTEKRLDAMMMRKRLDIQESVHRDVKRYGTMRIWVSNTVENQPWQYSGMDPNAYDFNSGVEATFKVKIEGRLIEPDADDSLNSDHSKQDGEQSGNEKTGIGGLAADGTETAANDTGKDTEEDKEPAAKKAKVSTQAVPRKKFSHFFKSITVTFDRSKELQPDGYTKIEWKRPEYQASTMMEPPKDADFDQLQFERKSDENINITISLVLDEQPEQYELAPALAELLDLKVADRQTVLMGLWDYIRMAGLRLDEDQRVVFCDARLQEIFGAESLYFPNLRDQIRPLLYDPHPIKLQYTIRVDKGFHSNDTPTPTIYDIRVPLDDPLKRQMHAATQGATHIDNLKAIARIDDSLALKVQELNHTKAKHNFYSSLSRDPANFIQRWIGSQKRDLDVIMGAGSMSVEDWQGPEWRQGGETGPWNSIEAREGVGSYLNRIKG